MHGIIFSQPRKYFETKHGSRAWSTLLNHARLENRAYLSVSDYADAEMEALVSAAAEMSGQSATVVPEEEVHLTSK
jgi:Haem-NO-binding